jgi:hypothetical protein
MTLLHSSAVRLTGPGTNGRKPRIRSLTLRRSSGSLGARAAGQVGCEYLGELRRTICGPQPGLQPGWCSWSLANPSKESQAARSG